MSDLEFRQAQRRAEQQYQFNEGPGWDTFKQKAGHVASTVANKAKDIASHPGVQNAAKYAQQWSQGNAPHQRPGNQDTASSMQNSLPHIAKIEQSLGITSNSNTSIDQRLAEIVRVGYPGA
jgi:hypothetical protein